MPDSRRKKTKCKACLYFEHDDNEKAITGFCVKNPPIPLAIPNMNQITGAMGIGVQAVFPPVTGDTGCYVGTIKDTAPIGPSITRIK